VVRGPKAGAPWTRRARAPYLRWLGGASLGAMVAVLATCTLRGRMGACVHVSNTYSYAISVWSVGTT